MEHHAQTKIVVTQELENIDSQAKLDRLGTTANKLNINLSLLNGHFKTHQRYRANIKVKINEQKVTMNIFCGLIVRVF